MAESLVQVTEGSGKKLHTWARTVGANTVEDEFTLPGEYPYASYIVQAVTATFASTNDHIITINAGASLNVRIRRIYLEQAGVAAAANLVVDLIRTTATTASGGTAITPRPLDSADAAAGATCQANPSTKGTVGVTLFRRRIPMLAAAPTSYGVILWEERPGLKPIIIPAGTTNGVALNAVVGLATHSADITIEFVETSFL